MKTKITNNSKLTVEVPDLGHPCLERASCSGRHSSVRQFIAMGFHKSTLLARGANTQLDPSCVTAPLATNVDLFACFAERLFKSSSIIY